MIKVIILNQNREKWGINTNKKKCFYDVQNVTNYCFVFPKIVQVRTWYIIYYRVPKGKILPFKCTYLSMFKNILTYSKNIEGTFSQIFLNTAENVLN